MALSKCEQFFEKGALTPVTKYHPSVRALLSQPLSASKCPSRCAFEYPHETSSDIQHLNQRDVITFEQNLS